MKPQTTNHPSFFHENFVEEVLPPLVGGNTAPRDGYCTCGPPHGKKLIALPRRNLPQSCVFAAHVQPARIPFGVRSTPPLLLAAALALALAGPPGARAEDLSPASTPASDPARWVETSPSKLQRRFFQGITSDRAFNLYLSGPYRGISRTSLTLKESLRNATGVPLAVRNEEGYNHVGDLSWDAAEGGRLLLPLECFHPEDPKGPNTCGTGSIGVADPVTLQWRYYVKLDPSEIRKAMWAEVSPDGQLVWTSSGLDLLAYRASDITPDNAVDREKPIHSVARLTGVLPFVGISGAAFYGGRLFIAGQLGQRAQVWAVDLATGRRTLEIERDIVGESEGLAALAGVNGELHWQIQPGLTLGRLLNFVPGGLPVRFGFSPRKNVVAGTSRRFVFQATVAYNGQIWPLSDVTVGIAGKTAVTNKYGRAAIRVRLPRPRRYRITANKRGLRRAITTVLVRPGRHMAAR